MEPLRFGREDGASGGGVSGHGGNFFKLEAGDESWGGRNTTPAVEIPTGAEEFDLGAQSDVEDHFSGSVIEQLRKSQERELAEFLEDIALGRAPAAGLADAHAALAVVESVYEKPDHDPHA